MKVSKVFIIILFSFFTALFVSCQKEQTSNQKLDLSNSKIVDISHSYSPETIYWVTAKEFKMDTVFQGRTDKGYYYSAYNFETAEHGGTHIDAPIHFAEGAKTVDQIPLKNLIGSAIKVDVSANALNNPDYLVTVDDLKAWEEKHSMQIPEGSIVLLQTGFSTYYPNKVKYMGTDERGEQAVELLHFPGLSPEAASWITENRKIHSIGIDTPSIDYGQSTLFKSHVILLSKNIPAFENLTNLELLPEKGFTIIALPMKIKGGSGSPLRIVALLN
ncbi:MAG: cyclase family protein [Flavobacteriaceae bacterium]